MERTVIYTDGSGNGNYGFLVEGKDPKYFHKEGITSNEAEYYAIIKAIEHINSGSKILIRSDSKLCVMQLTHKWKITTARLRPLAEMIWANMRLKYINVWFEWVPREENKMGKILW